jgi:hypothetical protein
LLKEVLMAETRPCDVCGQVDDHPRHIVHVEEKHPITGQDLSLMRHMDCCAQAGCPDGSCDVIVDHAKGKQGEQLRAHVVKNGDAIRKMVDEKAGA